MKSSSIQDVAQLAHVSISTVSRSFTRPDLVSKATRDKVMKAADELNFSISRSAAALKTGRALRIAVLVSGRLNLWFSSSIIEGLNEVFHDEGYDISIYQMSSTEERSEFFNMLPVRRNVDAVIVISFDIASNEIEQLRSIDVPIIGINSSLPEERGFNAVCSTRPCNQRNQRSERLMAEMMAFSELVTMEVSMPTPHTMLVLSSSPIWHST